MQGDIFLSNIIRLPACLPACLSTFLSVCLWRVRDIVLRSRIAKATLLKAELPEKSSFASVERIFLAFGEFLCPKRALEKECAALFGADDDDPSLATEDEEEDALDVLVLFCWLIPC